MSGPKPSIRDPASSSDQGIVLPVDLVGRLAAFRRRVRRRKFFEAACAGIAGLTTAFLAVFLFDRLWETPAVVRSALCAAAATACLAVPHAIRRWGAGLSSLEQVARLIGRRFPAVGDELVGIIELVHGGTAVQSRSRALCEAAVAQVAERSRAVDFRGAMPPSHPVRWAMAAGLPVVVAATLAFLVPDAAANAWRRLLLPLAAVERFTFAKVQDLPSRIVVPHGEPATVEVRLRDESRWRPREGRLTVGPQKPAAARLAGERYAFEIPPQVADQRLTLAVGDVRQRAMLAAVHRPELSGLEAEVTLPEYLERPGTKRQDLRGGVLAPVTGSRVVVVATANRDLAGGSVDGAAVPTDGRTIRTAPMVVADEARTVISWRDADGLEAAEPLELAITPRADAAPTVAMLNVPPIRGMLLETDTLKFRVAARDDFGIRRVGLAWEGLDDPQASAGATGDAAARERGERILQAGGGETETLDAAATFCPESLGIRPQPIVIRAFVEDYLPGRARVVSSPLVLYVVDRAEHALVLNTRLQQFRQQASEVRDREMGLLASNRELRKLPAEALGSPEARARLEAQAAAEEANARRLERLVDEGAELVREALKNPEFEAATLEQLAADIQTLADISENRMPGVADLLGQAATSRSGSGTSSPGDPAAAQPADGSTASPPGEHAEPGELADGGQRPRGEAPQVGEQRPQPDGPRPGDGEDAPTRQPSIPQVVDAESSQQPRAAAPPASSDPAAGRLGLPTTQAGSAPATKPAPGADRPAAELLDDAIAKQEELLAEFAKVADELAALMARLEGSTFVKRLKLAARQQGAIGSRIAALAAEAFGAAERQPEPVKQALGDVREQSLRETERMSALMDDLQAYFDRRQLPAFRTVLEEMKDLDTLGSLRQFSDDVLREAGMSIAQAEFWSDTFDRLADDLVPPPCAGGGEGSGSPRESVPAEVVLEAMKILDDEVNLREETRVAQQARSALDTEEFAEQARRLAERQDAIAERLVDLADRLLEEPDGERRFGPEIAIFEKVEGVMTEAGAILAAPDTGPRAIAAETEAIELLLAAQAAAGDPSGGGGGGGGAKPGGGGGGTATSAALALAGRGNRTGRGDGGEKDQATGTTGRVLPDEFRAGLDAYFNRYEKERR